MSRADEIAIAIRQLDSRDPNEVVKGLNLLLQVSFETENGSYHVRGLAGCLYLDAFPELALAIGSLLDVLNPIGEVVFRCYEDTTRRILHEWVDPNAVLRLDDFEEEEEDEWRVSLPGQLPGQEQLIKELFVSLDDNPMLINLLSIIRNLSFDMKNEFFLANSAPIVRHLTALQYAAFYTRSVNAATCLATEALVNIAHRIDVVSVRRQQFHCFLDDACGDAAKSRDYFNLRLSDHYSEASAIEYVGATTSLLSIAVTIISESPWRDRYMIVQMLQVLTKLAQLSDNALYISRCPQLLLNSLVRLLCVNTVVDDPLARSHGAGAARQQRPIAVREYGRGVLHKPFEASGMQVMVKTPASGPARNSSKEKNLAAASGADGAPSAEQEDSEALLFIRPPVPFFRDSSDEEMRDLALDTLLALAQLSSHASATATSASSLAAASLFTPHVVAMLATEVIDNPTNSMRMRIMNTPYCVSILFRIANSSSSVYGVTASSQSYPIPGAVDMSGRIIYNSISGSSGGTSNSSSSSSGSVGSGSRAGPSIGVGWGGNRSSGSDKSLLLLELLLTNPAAQQKVRSIRDELIAASFADDFIADLVCNKILPVHNLAPIPTQLPPEDGASAAAAGSGGGGATATSAQDRDTNRDTSSAANGDKGGSGLILKLSARS